MGAHSLKTLIHLNALKTDTLESERYRSLINILNGFEEYLLDSEGFIVSSNLEAVNVTGYEEWEVIGSHISKFYTIEDQLTGVPQKDLERTSRKGSLVTTGLRVKKRNSSFWAKVKIRTLTEEGQIVGYKMTLKDATHKAVSSHRVRKLKDEYLNLFNNSFVGILKFSMLDYHIFMLNEKAEKILGKTSEPTRLNQFFQENDFRHFIKELETHRKADDFEIKIAGTEQWVMLSFRHFPNGDFAEGVIVDITELKNRDIELNRVKHELDQFIYHASHELRGPLATMLGVVNLIEYEKDPESVNQYCGILKERIHGLDNLLKSIVAISLNNKSRVVDDTIEWLEIVPSVLREFSSNHRVETGFSIEQTYPFHNDLTRIRIILKNLVSNSVKYVNPTASKSIIQVIVQSGPDFATVIVRDNGIGIDTEYVNDIFKMFYKATAQAKGHGLGLYTVKVMMDKLNGKVKVESRLGEGTTFTLTIPNERISLQ